MEEADKNADRVSIIDNGKIIATGTPAEFKAKYKDSSLEEAFLQLTGKEIRDESAGLGDMRMRGRIWRR